MRWVGIQTEGVRSDRKERDLILSLRFGFGVFLLFGFLFLCFFFGSRLERFFDLRWILVREGFELIWVRRLK